MPHQRENPTVPESLPKKLRAKIKQLMADPRIEDEPYPYNLVGFYAAASEAKENRHWFTPSPPLMFQCRICGGSRNVPAHR